MNAITDLFWPWLVILGFSLGLLFSALIEWLKDRR